jgi:hypothetical protein
MVARFAARHFNLKDRYMMCWGYVESLGGVAFDVGGPQGGEMNVFVVDDTGTLISVNPANPAQRKPIGVLKLIEP